jgi:8-oxo-dGTP pyrophosphatase MutT (NUDIX family)
MGQNPVTIFSDTTSILPDTIGLDFLTLADHIRKALADRQRVPMLPGPVPAAVLLPLYRKDGFWHLLFTKRAENLHHHRGEISFPGGACHSEDRDTMETALRETWEEVGILPKDVDILGVLDDFYSVYDYLVTPYVGLVPADSQFLINPKEIERLMEVPLDHLLRPEIFHTEDWTWKERTSPVHFYQWGNDQIWGLTAAILKQFLDILTSRS